MEENRQHFGILCFIISRKVKVQQKCKKKICAVCGEGAVTGQMCQKRFAKFRAGDCSLDDAPLLGRLVEADSDQIETLIENNQCYPTWEIANIPVSYTHLTLPTSLAECRSRWSPYH